MRKTKAQRQAMQAAQICEQYKRPDWDGCRANDFFAGKLKADFEEPNAYEIRFRSFALKRESEMARNALYSNIAHLAFYKHQIINYLSQVQPNNIGVPAEIVWKDEYVIAYLNEAKDILEKIDHRSYPFQYVAF
jgi:hypothetical protein